MSGAIQSLAADPCSERLLLSADSTGGISLFALDDIPGVRIRSGDEEEGEHPTRLTRAGQRRQRHDRAIVRGQADATDAHTAVETLPRSAAPPLASSNPTFARRFGLRASHAASVSDATWYPMDPGLFTTVGKDGILLAWNAERFHPALSLDIGHANVTASTGRFRTPLAAGVSAPRGSPAQDARQLNACAFSPLGDSRVVAVASQDPRIRLVDLSSGSLAHTLSGHRGPVVSLAWSRSSPFLLASGSSDGQVRLWDVRRGGPASCLALLRGGNRRGDAQNHTTNDAWSDARVQRDDGTAHPRAVVSLHFPRATRNKLLSVGAEGQVLCWDLHSGCSGGEADPTIVTPAETGVRFPPVALSPAAKQTKTASLRLGPGGDEAFVVPGGDEGTSLAALDVVTGGSIGHWPQRAHFGQVNAIAVRERFQEVISAGDDGAVVRWSPTLFGWGRASSAERDAKEANARAARFQAGNAGMSTAPSSFTGADTEWEGLVERERRHGR